MERNYDRYVEGLFDRKLNEKERLILRVTRMFGECDAAAPPDYIREVIHYIEKWQCTGRFARAVKRAQDSGYTQKIAAAFIAQNLPPQYFYLAMQESDFDASRSGPPTPWGFAKGMWQFIPETGKRYGLKIGPLGLVPQPDQVDDRLNWEKATPAAARYIKDIYSTDAQASGLLVMASYNWGEFRVIDHPEDAGGSEGTQFLEASGLITNGFRCKPTITCSTLCRRRSSARTRGCLVSSSTTPRVPGTALSRDRVGKGPRRLPAVHLRW